MKNYIPTQKDEVLQYLQEHKTITALEGFNKLFIIDLAGCIRDLRKVYVITDEWIERTNFYGRATRYKKYIFKGKKQGVKQNG